ncbi:MAG: GNAT family N-acetyltransferase [Candidatus Hermodarchaeota archaeon]
MDVIDLNEKYKETYMVCLEEWSDEMKEAGNHKNNWYQEMKNKGLGVKLAVENENVVGMIQYIPIEYSFAEGQNLYIILCIWVHGYKEGVGNFQKRGIGKALLQAAEDDVKSRSAKGIVAWGLSLPFWMKAKWFKKQGYIKVDKQGMRSLLWKPFVDDAIPPKWFKQKKTPEIMQGIVKISAFINGWCPGQNIVFERAKRAASEFGDKVVFEEFNTNNRETFLEWGISDAIFIDGKEIRTGPPPSYEKIKNLIAKQVKKLR